MPRPRNRRWVSNIPQIKYFKPAGVPLSQLEEIVLTLPELEALRHTDLEEMYHEQAAELMKVSRQTFGRIISEARKKIATALLMGKAIRIEGGEYSLYKKSTTPAVGRAGPGRGRGRFAGRGRRGNKE